MLRKRWADRADLNRGIFRSRHHTIDGSFSAIVLSEASIMRAREAQFPESRAVFAPTSGGKLLAGMCNTSSPLRPPRSAAPMLQVSSDAAGASERRTFMIAVMPEFDALLKGCAPSKSTDCMRP